ncbi:MAG: hypothetical protein RIQ89_1081 [Bacteroidota bacterium]|jgi:hypothetical protein
MTPKIKQIKKMVGNVNPFATQSDQIFSNQYLHSVIYYNEMGAITLEEKYNSAGTCEEVIAYQYNHQNKPITIKATYPIDQTEEVIKITYDGLLKVKQQKFYGDDPGSYHTFGYNDEQLLIDHQSFDDDQTLILRETFAYQNSKLLQHDQHDFESPQHYSIMYEYPQPQTIIEQHWVDSKLQKSCIKTINEHGQEIKFEELNTNGKILHATTYHYDEHQRLIEINSTHASMKRKLIAYDESGLLCSSETYNAAGALIEKQHLTYENGLLASEAIAEIATNGNEKSIHQHVFYHYQFY